MGRLSTPSPVAAAPRTPTGEVETRASLGPRPAQQPLAGYLAVLEETRRAGRADVDRTGQPRHRHHIDGRKPAKKARFVTTSGHHATLDHASLQRARELVGLKGYVSNIPAGVMSAAEVISSYHDLWHVEQSFRMSKTDLAARPIFHHTRDAIEAHLTIVFAALAIAHNLQQRSGISLKKIIRTLRPLQHVTIRIGNQQLQAEPPIPDRAAKLLQSLGH